MASIGAMLSSPELYGKLATNPATRGFLSQPDFIAMLTDVQKIRTSSDRTCRTAHDEFSPWRWGST